MTEEITKIQELVNIRIEKLEKLREAGLDPYPHNYSSLFLRGLIYLIIYRISKIKNLIINIFLCFQRIYFKLMFI